MAEVLLRKALAARGVDDVTVGSAGTGGWEGAPASEGSLLVALEHGLDLSTHRARLLTPELIRSADLILTMSRHHRDRVAELGGGDKVHLLTEYAGGAGADVSDPFGAELESYRETYRELTGIMDAVASKVAAERSRDQR